MELFTHRSLVIATMHKKEEIIAPILAQHFNVNFTCPPALNTDVLGTFTGEIPRINSAYETALKKCELALEITGCDLAIASEGSFGAHPHAFMLPVNEELLVLIDRKNNFVIKASTVSLATNFTAETITSLVQLRAFAERVKFPSHGIIISNTKEQFTRIEKGIQDIQFLENIAQELLNEQGAFYAQTDMRAHMNPSRQSVIEQTTHKLVELIYSSCPQCNAPGFDRVETIKGLPCEYCSYPTNLALRFKYECQCCHFKEERSAQIDGQSANQAYCDLCNP